MKNDEILNEVNRRFGDQKEYIDAKFTHLSAIIQAGFDMSSKERQEIIKHQKETNGRVTGLENFRILQEDTCTRVQSERISQKSKQWRYLTIGVLVAAVLASLIHEVGLWELIKFVK